MYAFGLFALRTGVFAEGSFMGKVLDEWLADTQDFLRTKLPHLIVIAIIAFVLTRVLRLITSRMIHIAERHAADTIRIGQVRTLAGVVRTTGIAVICAIVGLQFLAAVGINLSPLLTSAGIAGVAIGLAAQSLVKDMLNGTIILVEDQFNVGDVVTIAGLTGTVEAMTLRKTTVRASDGTRYTVPNSQITTVANQSANFTVATIPVSVDYSADPDRVIALLTRVANDVRNMPEFADLFVAEPQVLGVDAVKGSQLIFPVLLKTKATKHYAPMREFQRRVRLALEQNQLLPGDPLRVLNSFDGSRPSSSAAPPPRDSSRSGKTDPTTLLPQDINPFSGQ